MANHRSSSPPEEPSCPQTPDDSVGIRQFRRIHAGRSVVGMATQVLVIIPVWYG